MFRGVEGFHKDRVLAGRKEFRKDGASLKSFTGEDALRVEEDFAERRCFAI